MRLPLIIVFAGLTACAAFPQLDANLDAKARAADFPRLQPLTPLLAQADTMQATGQISPVTVARFAARTAQLSARASRLRGPVIDAATLARMRRGVAVPAAIR